MKEIIGIIVIIMTVCITSFFLQSYLQRTGDEMLSELNTLKEAIKQPQENTKEKSSDVISKWEEINEIWSTIVMHQELDNIKLSILQVNAAIEVGSFEDALEEIDKTIFLVGHIKEKELFGLKNIF